MIESGDAFWSELEPLYDRICVTPPPPPSFTVSQASSTTDKNTTSSLFTLESCNQFDVDPTTNPSIPYQFNPSLTPPQVDALVRLVEKLTLCFPRDPMAPPKPSPGVRHTIHLTNTKVVSRAPYRTSPEKQEIIDKQVDNFLKRGIIRPSTSPWASPVTLQPKPHKIKPEWRFCIDYRGVNSQTEKDAYPMPLIQHCLEFCSKADWLTLIDIKDAYWHIEMDPASIPITAFVTRKGHFEWTRLPFGLCNAPATFQRYVNDVLREHLGVRCSAFFDDVNIFTTGTFEEHLADVEKVLTTLGDHGLEAALSKCRFAFKEVRYVGHVINKGTIKPDPEKVRAIAKYPIPVNIKELRSFLGLTNYYRQFVPEFALKAAPLYGLLKKNVKFQWGSDQQGAFNLLISALMGPTCLYAPDFTKEFILQTDASGNGISGVLAQKYNDGIHPIGFISRQLNAAERNYSATEQECLAVVGRSVNLKFFSRTRSSYW